MNLAWNVATEFLQSASKIKYLLNFLKDEQSKSCHIIAESDWSFAPLKNFISYDLAKIRIFLHDIGFI